MKFRIILFIFTIIIVFSGCKRECDCTDVTLSEFDPPPYFNKGPLRVYLNIGLNEYGNYYRTGADGFGHEPIDLTIFFPKQLPDYGKTVSFPIKTDTLTDHSSATISWYQSDTRSSDYHVSSSGSLYISSIDECKLLIYFDNVPFIDVLSHDTVYYASGRLLCLRKIKTY
jgi:hypothetical protein